jgi:hypothetical protein
MSISKYSANNFKIKTRYVFKLYFKGRSDSSGMNFSFFFCFGGKFWSAWIRIPSPVPLAQLNQEPKYWFF